jgi:streptogramin lyase
VELSPTGKVLAIWERPMDLGMDGIAVDPQGNIYFVSETGTGSIVKLSPSGAVLASWPATCPVQ